MGIEHQWELSPYTTPSGRNLYHCPVCGLYDCAPVKPEFESRKCKPGEYAGAWEIVPRGDGFGCTVRVHTSAKLGGCNVNGIANGEVMQVRLVSATHKPLLAIATAAAITRGQTHSHFCSDSNRYRLELEDYVRRLHEAGHWSILEFADFDFEVEGASRVFETQVVRSRIGSYEWESGRRGQKYKPSAAATTLVLGKHIDYAVGAYESIVEDEGMQPENARYVIPQGVARKGRIKKNLRAWMETAHQRLCSKTQWEYREFMQTVKELITKEDAFLGSLLVPKCEWLGYCPEENGCGRKRPKKDVIALRVWYVAINAKGEVVDSNSWLDGAEQHVSAASVAARGDDTACLVRAWSSDGPDEALRMARARLQEIER